MKKSEKKEHWDKKTTEIKIFAVPSTENETNKNITTNVNIDINLSKKQIIAKASQFHSEGNIKEFLLGSELILELT